MSDTKSISEVSSASESSKSSGQSQSSPKTEDSKGTGYKSQVGSSPKTEYSRDKSSTSTSTKDKPLSSDAGKRTKSDDEASRNPKSSVSSDTMKSAWMKSISDHNKGGKSTSKTEHDSSGSLPKKDANKTQKGKSDDESSEQSKHVGSSLMSPQAVQHQVTQNQKKDQQEQNPTQVKSIQVNRPRQEQQTPAQGHTPPSQQPNQPQTNPLEQNPTQQIQPIQPNQVKTTHLTQPNQPNQQQPGNNINKDNLVTFKGGDGKTATGIVTRTSPEGVTIKTAEGSEKTLKPGDVQKPEQDKTTGKVDPKAKTPENSKSARKQAEKDIGPKRDFPNLKTRQNPGGQPWQVVGGKTPKTNCIGHSNGTEGDVWPNGGDNIQHFNKEVYAPQGFVQLPNMDMSNQKGIEKSVLYAVKPGDSAYNKERANMTPGSDPSHICTHAVRQQKDGTWTSKQGQNEKLRISHPNDIAGGMYGYPIAVFARPRRED